MRSSRITLHSLIYASCLRHPIKTRIVAVLMVGSVLAYGIHHLMLYRSYKVDLATAEVLRMEADRLIMPAVMVQDELLQLRNSLQMRQKSPREEELETQLAEYQRDIEAQYASAMASYNGLPQRYRSTAGALEEKAECLTSRIGFTIHLQRYKAAGHYLDHLKQVLEQWGSKAPPEVAAFAADAERRIKGQGSLTIQGGENIVEVIVFPYDEFADTARFSQADAVGRSSDFPFKIEPVWSGSYLVWMTSRQGSYVPYPVYLERSQNMEVQLELPASIPEGMAFVPGGRFFYGGEDSHVYRKHARKLPSFFIKKHEVTVAEYLAFWTSLADPELRNDFMSRIRFSEGSKQPITTWNEEGKLLDDRLNLAYPVVGISFEAAKAYCAWLSVQRGVTVRLPTAEEWEKAARGVDGRRYVWGNGLDVALALTQSNQKGKAAYPLWAPPGKFPNDSSVYNVFDMAGNVREMTSSLLPPGEEGYQLKGGSAFTPESFLPCSSSSDSPVIPSDIGFRYVQELP